VRPQEVDGTKPFPGAGPGLLKSQRITLSIVKDHGRSQSVDQKGAVLSHTVARCPGRSGASDWSRWWNGLWIQHRGIRPNRGL